MSSKFKFLALGASALVFALCLSACSSDSDDKKAADPDSPDAAKAAKKDAKKKSSHSSESFFDTVDRKLDKSRVDNADDSDMYIMKNKDKSLFHDHPRSQDLIDKNQRVDPSYYE